MRKWLLLPPLLASLGLMGFPSVEAQGEPELKAVPLTNVNTAADEVDPYLAPSGLALFYAAKKDKDFEIMVATRRLKSQNFGAGQVIEELCGKGDDVTPFLMPKERDGSEYLYFAARQPDAKNFDVFFTRRLKPDQPFQRIAIAGVHQVCTPEDETHPWVSSDAQEMYFSRKTKEGWRIGYAKGSAPRAFEHVTLLDLPVGFQHPTVAKDGLTMYLQGPAEGDRQGIFVSKRSNRAAKWGKPQLVPGLDGQEGKFGDGSPSLAEDGSGLYFASDRSGGKGGTDLYFVSRYDLRKATEK